MARKHLKARIADVVFTLPAQKPLELRLIHLFTDTGHRLRANEQLVKKSSSSLPWPRFVPAFSLAPRSLNLPRSKLLYYY